jgi:putative nucleotidyltransferase-like protein
MNTPARNGYVAPMVPAESEELESLREALKVVAVALKESGLPFALAGGYAAWVHGSPEPLHDVDFLVRSEDAPTVADELGRRGLQVEHPPEDWLLKVRFDGCLIDVLHRTQGSRSVDDMLDDAREASVLSVVMPVLSATDVTIEKLLAMDEHYCDLAAVLPTMRALREQVDWAEVRRRTAGRPFAETVLFLLERLRVIAPTHDERHETSAGRVERSRP